jgi:hypothetical protein
MPITPLHRVEHYSGWVRINSIFLPGFFFFFAPPAAAAAKAGGRANSLNSEGIMSIFWLSLLLVSLVVGHENARDGEEIPLNRTLHHFILHNYTSFSLATERRLVERANNLLRKHECMLWSVHLSKEGKAMRYAFACHDEERQSIARVMAHLKKKIHAGEFHLHQHQSKAKMNATLVASTDI